MKKMIRIWVVIVCVALALPVQAQLHWGVKGGLNLSKASFSKSMLEGKNQTGWFIGPMAEFTIPLLGVGVDAAALYSQTDLAAKTGTEIDTKLKTIEVPVNLKWTFGLGSMAGAYVAAGPQFGFNVSNKKGLIYELKKNCTSFNVGAGVKLIRHIQAGVNYNFALSRTATLTYAIDADRTESIKIKNNTWQVSLAYMF